MHDVLRDNTLMPHSVKLSCFSFKLFLDFLLSWVYTLNKICFLAKTSALFNLGVVSINFRNLLVDLEHGRVVFAILFERSIAQLVAQFDALTICVVLFNDFDEVGGRNSIVIQNLSLFEHIQ